MAKQPTAEPAPSAKADDQPSRLARLRAAIAARMPHWSPRTTLAVLVVVMLIVGNGVALVVWLPKYLGPEPKHRFTMSMALAALDRHSLAEAKHIATQLTQSNELDASERGGPPFIFGAVAAEEAELLPPSERKAAYQSAAKFLEEARDRGFPQQRQAQGLFLLGRVLFSAGDFTACRTPLEEAAHDDGKLARETNRMLASAYSQGADPDFVKARDFSERCLADHSLTGDERSHAQLLNAQILDKLNDIVGCKAALTQIPATSTAYPAAIELDAELLMRDAHAALENPVSGADARAMAKAKCQQAIEKLKLVETNGNSTTPLERRAMYMTGVCWLECGIVPAAREQFERILVADANSDAGVAAVFQLADLLRREGRYEEAAAMYRRGVKLIGDPGAYHNDLLSVDAVRKQMLASYEQYLANKRFDEAVQLSQLLPPLFPRERELELTGELYRAAGKSYLSQWATAAPEQAKTLAAKARLNFRLAGLSFSKLAEFHITTRTYSDDLWNAAECFEQGHDYRHAIQSLDAYLKNESRRRYASALLMLGEAQLTLGETDKAMAALQECVDRFPSDPACYRARLLMATAYSEKSELPKAESLLRANLEGGILSPRSVEWRDSLFALGKLLAGDGRYQDAVLRLGEAVARYPHAEQSIEAQYLVAECYRRLGLQHKQQLADDTIEASRLLHQKQMQENLNSAVTQFQQLVATLGKETLENSTPLSLSILRNSYFALAVSLFDLNRFDDAIRVYGTIANVYRNQPEVLEALVQAATCYRKLDRLAEARGAVAQAKSALERLDKNTNFAMTTNYSREEWRQLLDRMATL